MKLLVVLTTILTIHNSMSSQERWWSRSSNKPYFSKDVDFWHIAQKDESTDTYIRQTSHENQTIYGRDEPPADHAVFQLFSFQNFPTNDQNTRRNQAAYACIEAIGILVDSLAALNSMDDPRIASSFLRYFESEHIGEVRLVIESLVRQLGAEIFPGAQRCIPRPELLPLMIHYDSPPQIPSLCEGTLLALPEVLDSSGEPIEPSVQYMVICPRWFETGRWRLVDGVNEDLQAYWATEYGYAVLVGQVGAGLESSSTASSTNSCTGGASSAASPTQSSTMKLSS
ncbi:hypothetical protein LTR70_010602 [Exophiala xenobiotica]|uniref:Uncharacterized protein n=1 Tax=Lithohypha guttulata TaxID=1690604 RepID=A0ABR0JTC1_9EURO|nr:hypothetical protein LTR24_010651 [Lithohypha guttulata]KAK5309102.1 hypothetical protein LTR70_010602 [Exophiala xenobiotica]